MENELHQARMLGIFVELDQEAYFDDNSDDGFPHKGLPIFARNKNTTGIYLRKGNSMIHFNIPITTLEGRIWAIRIDRTSGKDLELSMVSLTEMNTERAHYYSGQNIIWETRATAKHLGWKLTRTPFNRCEACAIGKAKKSNLGDGESNPPKTIGELWGTDGMKLKIPIREVVRFSAMYEHCC